MAVSASYDFQNQLQRFSLQQFRPGQRDVIETVLAGSDCLCIMPTGGGKSLCYQLPAVMREGVTLVVSPLIALMKDQVDSLRRLEVPAAFINSTLSAAEQADRISRMEAGEFRLVYVAPERFRSPRFMEVVGRTPVQLLAVDEAHCISEWGHDFRPDYTRLGLFRRRLGNPQTIALTATATPDVRADVVRQLGLKSPRTFIAGFSRPNLFYQVRVLAGRREKEDALFQFLRQHPGSGIIYASTRKGCEEVAQNVARRLRRSASAYHAGLELDQRRKVQEDFMAGRLEIVVATNAFGMGIDKADVRFVIHYNFPGSLEAYYQEAGRAGRDGQPATCLLLYCSSDRHIQEFFIESAYPSAETVAQVYEFLRNHQNDPIEMTQQTLKETLQLSISTEGVGTCERLLEKSGVLKRVDPHRNMAAIVLDSDLPTLVDLLPPKAQVRRKVLAALEQLVGPRRHETVYFHPREIAQSTALALSTVGRALRELNQLSDFDYVPPFRGRALHLTRRDLEFKELSIDFEGMEKRRRADRDKLNQMVRYAKIRRCRQQEVLRYFGERGTSPCGHCDNCQRQGCTATDSPPAPASAAADDALVQAVKMALSGVARTQGRFGKNVVAAMLWGSKSVKMARWKLDRLSTFGLLNHLRQREVSELIEALIDVGLLEQSEIDRFRPVVQLTDQGWQVMQGKQPLDTPLSVSPSLHRKLSSPKQIRPAQPPRADAATSPSYRPAASTPRQPIVSVAPAAPTAPAGSNRDGDHQPPADREPLVADRPRPRYYWTWRLLADGYSSDECAAIRQLPPEKVLDHAVQAAEDGLHVDGGWLLSPAQVAALEELVGDPPRGRLQDIVAQLPDGLGYEHLMLFLKCGVKTRKSRT